MFPEFMSPSCMRKQEVKEKIKKPRQPGDGEHVWHPRVIFQTLLGENGKIGMIFRMTNITGSYHKCHKLQQWNGKQEKKGSTFKLQTM